VCVCGFFILKVSAFFFRFRNFRLNCKKKINIIHSSYTKKYKIPKHVCIFAGIQNMCLFLLEFKAKWKQLLAVIGSFNTTLPYLYCGRYSHILLESKTTCVSVCLLESIGQMKTIASIWFFQHNSPYIPLFYFYRPLPVKSAVIHHILVTHVQRVGEKFCIGVYFFNIFDKM